MSKYLLAFVTAAGLLAACTETPDDPDTDPPPPPPPVMVDTVEVWAPTLDLHPGDQIQLTARALDADGQLLTGRTFAWHSDDETVATVDDDGTVTALAVGEVTVYATTALVSGGAFFTVSEKPQVGWIDVHPGGHVELEPGATFQLTATVYDWDGHVLEGRALTWSSASSEVATVSATGLVTAIAAGDAWITVECEGLIDEMVVRVPDTSPPPVIAYTLVALGGHALPVILGSFTETHSDGSTTTRSVRVYDGSFTVDHDTRTFATTVRGIYVTAASWVPIPITYDAQGTFDTDATSGVMTFTSETGDTFTGLPVASGLQVHWQPDDRMSGASTFLFATE